MNNRKRRIGTRALLGLFVLSWQTSGLIAQQAGSDLLSIQDSPESSELVISLGPVDLPAHSGPTEIAQMPVQRGTFPFDMMVHGYRVEAVDGEGNPVPHAVIHHFNLLDPSRRELFLPIMRRIFASGQETAAQAVPEHLFGLPLNGGDPFLMLTKVFNPTDRSYQNVHVRLVLSYTRGGPPPMYRISSFHLDVMFPLGLKAFDLPPGRSEHSWEGSPVIGGAIVAMGGHLHRYARSLKLEDVTAGKVLYEIQAATRPNGLLESVPIKKFFTDDSPGLPIDPSHVYRVSAVYLNPTGKTISRGGMASVAGAFIPNDEAAWPAADPDDPVYATDFRNVMESTTALGEGLRTPSVELAGHAGVREPPELPGGSELVRVIDHSKARELELVIGPAALKVSGHHVRLPIQLVTLPIDGWLHGFSWKVTDAAGNSLPDALLHHINLIDPDQRELFAPMPRRVMAAGRETPEQSMPRILGYPIRPGTRVLVSAMFARPTERDYPQVYLHLRLSYTRAGGLMIKPRSVYPFYLDVMGPVGRKSFRIPPGGTVRSWTGSPAVDGRILALGAHLHDYAVWIRLEDVTEGEAKVIWEAKPEREPNGHVTGVPTTDLWKSGGLKIYKNRRYRIAVRYDNPTDRYNPEPGMGEIGGIVLVSDASVWPPLDRHDPTYVADLTNTLEAPQRLQGR